MYAALLVVAVLGLAVGLLVGGFELGASAQGVLVLAALALFAERQSVRLTSHTEVSLSSLPILFAAVVYGPLAAMAVGALALAGEFRRPLTRWTIWTASRALAGGFAGLIAATVPSDSVSFGSILLATAAGGAGEGLVDAVLVSTTASLRGNGSFAGRMRTLAKVAAGTLPLHVPLVAILAYAYVAVSPWTSLLFLAPALALQRLLGLYQEQRVLSDDLRAANGRLKRASDSFALALVAALDARDHYTAGHSEAVARYAHETSMRMGLPDDVQRLSYFAALLHDIGKVGLPPGILEKAGPLTPAERIEMEQHAVIGERILEGVEDYALIATAVRHHHERVDGTGYPDGLVGHNIPLVSRIVAVADAYSAMTSGRSYREALPVGVAWIRLRKASGTQFDAEVVEAFEHVILSEWGKAPLAPVEPKRGFHYSEPSSWPALVNSAH